MDDQFGGRTDDDLFYDDFEPVNSEAVLVYESQSPELTSFSSAPSSAPEPVDPSRHSRQPSSLSTSRFARKGNGDAKNQQQHSTQPLSAAAHRSNPTRNITEDSPHEDEVDAPTDSNAPATSARETTSHGSQNAALEARLGSGGNPRQKLTEEELAAKMEKMKLLSAEKARKFEKAEQDEKQHAQVYAKGMEEARKRRAEDAERRRRGEEDKRKMDDERIKNRERKLKAMSMKQGGWDEGKEAALEEEARKGFRGANGGVRGTIRDDGFGYSRSSAYGRSDGQERADVDRFLDERHRNRRRGRGEGGPGPAFNGGPPASRANPKNTSVSAPTLTADEFPALPSDGRKKKSDTATVSAGSAPKTEVLPIPSLEGIVPEGSKWDDEMELLDELKRNEQPSSFALW
ncbi:hypothetical protein E4U32_000728 [Claviceps aff. humidiphila group G2b]|nr:hypothetical protein E4U32_000728 [Claviceps aff. humidiphila group G2b]